MLSLRAQKEAFITTTCLLVVFLQSCCNVMVMAQTAATSTTTEFDDAQNLVEGGSGSDGAAQQTEDGASDFFDSFIDGNTGSGSNNPAQQDQDQLQPTIAPTYEGFYNPDISTLTDQQEIVLSLASLITGTLSFLGSMIIVYRVYKKYKTQRLILSSTTNAARSPPGAGGGYNGRRKRPQTSQSSVVTTITRPFYSFVQTTTPYDRIMLGLSISDMISSLTWAISPFLLPEDTSARVWAKGSDASCSFLGMLTQLSFASIWYNGMLSIYYLLTVRFGVKRERFQRRYELAMHLSTIIYFGGTALVGIFINLYSEIEVTQGCWIGEYPQGCEALGTCTSTMIGWIYGGIPFLFTFLSLPINNMMIYCYTRKQLSLVSSSEEDEEPSSESGEARGPESPPSSSTPPPARTASLLSSASGSSSVRSIISTISATRSSTSNPNSQNAKRIREVATQGFLYVFTFYVCYTPAFIIRLLEGLGLDGEKESDIYPVLVLNSILLPIQGFFNVFIYTRPNYVRVQAAFPEQSKWWIMKHACLESDIPRLGTNSRHPITTAARNNSNNKKVGGDGTDNNNNNSNGSSDSKNGSGIGRLSSHGRSSTGSAATGYFASNLDVIHESHDDDHPSETEGDWVEGGGIDSINIDVADDVDHHHSADVCRPTRTATSNINHSKNSQDTVKPKGPMLKHNSSSFRMVSMDGSIKDDSDHH